MRWLQIAALLIVGCKPGSYEAFVAQVTEASCDRDVKCGRVGASERQLCPRPLALGESEPAGVDPRGAISNQLMRFDDTGAQACIDATRRASCEAALQRTEIALSCHNVVQPAIPVGGACSGAGQCVGGTCEGGHCVAHPAPGSLCLAVGGTAAQTCDDSVQYCGGVISDGGVTETRCLRRKQEGGDCATTAECTFGNLCIDGACLFEPRAKRDQPCGGFACDECDYCSPRARCEGFRKRGEPCEAANACEAGLACIGLDDGHTGTCDLWLDRGQPCQPAQVTGCPATQQCTDGRCG